MKKIAIFLIKIYQNTLSPDHGPLKKLGIINKQVCVFYPTCSEYSKEAINKYGLLKGSKMTLIRLSKCHPWQENHWDPVK